MSIAELNEKLKADKSHAKEVNIAQQINMEAISENKDEKMTYNLLVYWRGFLAGLYMGHFIEQDDYEDLLRQINSAWMGRKRGTV